MKNTVFWVITRCSSDRKTDVSEEHMISIFKVEARNQRKQAAS
jgi:negative regulator of replication initiation